MKVIILFVFCLFMANFAYAQGVSISTDASTADNSAMLDVKSTSKGLLIPRMTQAQRTAIASPATGLLVFDTDSEQFYFYTSGVWTAIPKTESALHYIGTSYLGQTSGVGSVGTTEGTSNNLHNVYIGNHVGNANTSASENVGIGEYALANVSTGGGNIGIGKYAGSIITTGTNNTIVGHNAGVIANGITNATAIGANALASANNTVILGNNANVGIGTPSPADKLHVVGKLRIDAGKIDFRNTGESVFIGQEAGLNDDLANRNNTFIGYQAGMFNTSGNANVFVGSITGRNTSTGTLNTALGTSALTNNTIGSSNVALGRNALSANTTGSGNIAIGEGALQDKTLGNNNTIIGQQAMTFATNASSNVAVGTRAGYNNLIGTGNIFLGYEAGRNEIGNNKLYIANSNTTSPLIWGDFASNYVNINGNLGVGTSSPTQAKFVVNGSQNNNLAYGYLNSAGSTGTISSTTNAYSIYASDRIAATEFNAYSDARIKKILRRTNNANDLAILANIRITDYTHIDSISKGNKEVKKVIAQELKTVYPQAVSTIIDVIPDIYKQATITEGGLINLPTSLKVGEKVKLILPTGEELVEVIQAGKDSFRVKIDKIGNVFVYGRQVNDFHTVDYEALTTLNVSATQELLKKIEALEKENQEMKTVKAEVTDLKKQMADIQLLLQQSARK
jgi:hypothetical protein